jgi:hypothetical protein
MNSEINLIISIFILIPAFIESDVLTDHLVNLLTHILFQLFLNVPSVEPESDQNESEKANYDNEYNSGVVVF